MFDIFKTSKELQQVKADNANLIKRLGDKETELTEARSVIEKLTTSNMELGKQVDGLKTDVEAAKKSANKEAAQILATVGVPEGTIKETPATKTDAETLAEFNALTGAAATKFYNLHRDAILRAQGVKK